jgi:hypothetical protein
METIIEFRDDLAPVNAYPRRIVSPTRPSSCCAGHMARVGQPEIDVNWRFYYKRCTSCGYTVRCFYALSLVFRLEQARAIRLTLAEMNLGAGTRKRRTREEIAEEIAAAERQSLHVAVAPQAAASPLRLHFATTATISAKSSRSQRSGPRVNKYRRTSAPKSESGAGWR